MAHFTCPDKNFSFLHVPTLVIGGGEGGIWAKIRIVAYYFSTSIGIPLMFFVVSNQT